eukprot:CAMPEP_0177617828 /NCGR_PEP_ID=MMETSP0419_2-20121207/25165_1 /TAXON_ID=582737 /ORGANISM="Tetraselmis sp., Strain GSL018" /LENGTH=235 /DNA_ID=CAMNT_0019116515 /DNA_START=566 /DNA_END=1270 /DNA_ORIENTATION=+
MSFYFPLFPVYVLEHKIGSGAQGEVYFGFKDGACARNRVAVKLLPHPSCLSRSTSQLQQREMQIHSKLSHPNIVQFFEVAMTLDGKPAIVMEHVSGFTITRYMELCNAPLAEGLARHIFKQVMCAVEYLHTPTAGKGVVIHRDIKLANILLSHNFEVKLCDFGLAMETSAGMLTHSRAGTTLCMAPEVLSHRAYDGTKADIWSCGVLLYAMVAGKIPFWDPQDESIGLDERKLRW